ncbi:glycosyltransferase [Tamlana sp. 2_MG-2023]|uniref:glycosyltransferase family 4 protein n=1 Tax=unclassified Tamlana TaxID=2614803 RepID=UPI0026E22CA5|nr:MULTISPECIES: glycosyltransferase [unclassified Tamlana]MDO6760253.1 glycosyltransferase [Tamlana sp. 2_MG-2023]MDO6790049.1 glycosyltransferase [Tamlana sp. 1_MG-2023]
MSNTKPHILIFTDWFLPAYKAGGPIQSVANLVNHLGQDYHFWVVTSNTDLDAPLPLRSEETNVWLQKDNYQVIYLDRQHQNLKAYKKIITHQNFKAVYFNSLFSPKFTLLPLWLTQNSDIKIVLAPRGMLGKGALAIKPLKKKVFLSVFKAFGLPNKIHWHATDSTEKENIQKHFDKKSKIYLASNLSSKMENNNFTKKKKANSINIFFVSRISVIKNLLITIKTLQLVDKKLNVNYKIIGPIEEKTYWSQCQREIEKLPSNVTCEYLGAIPNIKLKDTLKDLHVLFLPTQHENFGHVIMEAWQNACPVIISKNTPWKNLEERKIGFDIALEHQDAFKQKIEQFAKMDEKEFNSWSQASFNFAKNFTENPELISKTKALFE